MKANGKRILNVTIKRMIDDSPDTSHLGKYGSSPESEYAIDRRHDYDCPINSGKLAETHKMITGPNEELDIPEGTVRCADCGRDAYDCQHEACEEFECECVDRTERNTYRYFNGVVENYEGCTPEEIRQYVRQDYERMEAGNQGDWYMLGIRAEAQVQLMPHGTIQRITSGGLWGIESDSGDSYLTEVEGDELSDLRDQLEALGFSKRAVSVAFKQAEHTR